MTFCIMDRDCAVFDRATGLTGLAYGSVQCQGCRDALRNDLNLLRFDYVDLTQLLPPADVRQELGKIARPKPESKPNINMAALGLRGDIVWLVALVALAVRRRAGVPLRADLPVREGFRLDTDVRYLTERPDDIASLPASEAHWDAEKDHPELVDGPGLVRRLRALHRRARRMCGTDPRVVTVPGFCPDCSTPSLRRADDAETVWCLHCKIKMDQVEYGRVVRLQIAPAAGE